MENFITTKTQLVRVQSKVTEELQRRIKAAAALSGKTIEDWMSEAATEKLEREGY